MEYLIYMSTAARLFSTTDLEILLKQSQANNANNKITGMLLYSEASFVQVLEGEPADVQKTYDKIEGDSRHKNVMKLVTGKLTQRIFPDWTMGFKTLSKEQFSEFEAYKHPSDHEVLKGDDSHPAITILKTFAESNHL